jgi:hypothetical protein
MLLEVLSSWLKLSGRQGYSSDNLLYFKFYEILTPSITNISQVQTIVLLFTADFINITRFPIF